MAAVVQLDPKQRPPAGPGSPLTLGLREFIDHVIVPILVKEYLATTDQENELAKTDSDAANSAQHHGRTEVRTVRP